MSLWAILPVKPLRLAKSRLAPVLEPAQRYELAQAMLRHVISVTSNNPSITGLLVTSRDTKALAIARELGAKSLQEGARSSLNTALTGASAVLQSWHADGILILPADLPFIHADDIRAIIAHANERSLVIATDRERDGTNAMLLRPPGAIDFAFGPGSFQRHCLLAHRAGLSVVEYESERLALDIDVPEDLQAYHAVLARGHFGHLPAFPAPPDE